MTDHATARPSETPSGEVAALIDGGEMDCGSGLPLLITRAMRRLDEEGHLGIRSAEASVVTDTMAVQDAAARSGREVFSCA